MRVGILAGLLGATLATLAAHLGAPLPPTFTRLHAIFAMAGAGLAWLLLAAVRRRLGPALAGGLALLASAAWLFWGPSAPAVYLVVIDCLSADRLATMPATSAFASRAWRFPYAHAQSSWTRSAVASLLTGTWPVRHGLYRLRPTPDRVADGVPRLAVAFRDAGWATAAFVDQAQLDPAFGLAEGFTRFNFRDGDAPRLLGKLARWDRFHRHVPRFVYVHLLDAHKPYEPDAAWLPEEAPGVRFAPGEAWGPWMDRVNRGELTPSAQDWARLRGLHEAELRQLDATLAGLWARLEGEQDAWVVVTADHGEAFGEHGWFTHGGPLYEGLLRVPLVIRPPGGVEGRVGSGVPRQVDVMPTLLAAVGIPAPEGLDGVDLGPAMRGGALPSLVSFAEYRGDEPAELAVTSGRWKYMRGRDGERLFDLEADAGERVDVGEAHPDVIAELRAEAERYLAGGGDGEAATGVAEGTMEGLRALGYVR